MNKVLNAILIALIPVMTLGQENQEVQSNSQEDLGWHQVTLKSGDQSLLSFAAPAKK